VTLGQKLAGFDDEPTEDLDVAREFFESGLPVESSKEQLLMKEDAEINFEE